MISRAKCRDFEVKKVRKSAEKDSLAEREGFSSTKFLGLLRISKI